VVRTWGRRLVVAGVLLVQLLLIVRGFSADHPVGAWRMFPEASDWRADIVRVDVDGTRVPVTDAEWAVLVRGRGLTRPSVRHHADAGVDNQLAFLRSALDWYADHDGAAGDIEATVTYWRNLGDPVTVVYRSAGT
jgi:hypothetical protein